MTSDNAKAIEQLKTSQEHMASDNMKAIEQLKTSQEQVARDNAKTVEQVKASQEKIAGFIADVSKFRLGHQFLRHARLPLQRVSRCLRVPSARQNAECMCGMGQIEKTSAWEIFPALPPIAEFLDGWAKAFGVE